MLVKRIFDNEMKNVGEVLWRGYPYFKNIIRTFEILRNLFMS